MVDDGSSDGTTELITTFSDPRIILIKQRHVGIYRLAESYNRALRECRSPLVAILEGDDFWPSEKLRTQVGTVARKEVVLSYGLAGMTTEKGMEYAVSSLPRVSDFTLANKPPGSILSKLLFHNFIPAVTVIMKRESLEEIDGFVQPRGANAVDYATWIRLSLKGEFSFMRRRLGFSRKHPTSASLQSTYAEYASNYRYGLDFLSEIGTNLDNAEEIAHRLRKVIYLLQFRYKLQLGRKSLVIEDWKGARSIFRDLLRSPDPQMCLASCLGLYCSYTHTSLERLMRMLGGYPLRIS